MNIALLSTGFLSNGKEATAITLMDFARELTKRGHTVTIISEKRKEQVRLQKIDGVTIYRVGFPCCHFNPLMLYNKILAHSLGIRRIQKKKGKFEVIHGFSAAPILAGREIASYIFNHKAKLIHTLKSYSTKKWGDSFYFLLNYVNRITVPTQIFKNNLMAKKVNGNKIAVIHSHINTHKFQPMNKKKLKQKYGYKNKKIIFYYGAMWEKKGTDILIKAIPEVIKNNPDTLFLFAPRNLPYAYKFKKLIQRINLPENIKVLIGDLNIVEYVNLADIIVLPYPTLIGTEGNPSCLLEAMACKTPVITTELPELKEIVIPEKEVLMAKPGKVISLSQEINRLLNNPKLQKKLAERAYQKSKQFDLKKITDQFIELYK